MTESVEAHIFEPYRLVDDIPGAYQARVIERMEAEDILEKRRLTYETSGVLPYLPVDALSTADAVLEAEVMHGQNSQQYTERYKGLILDCQRLVSEWYRKKKPEYFPPVRHVFNEAKEEFFSHGLSIRQMTENALTPMTDNPEEESRRINERVEDATSHIIRKLGNVALGDMAIRTISECTDKAIEDYAYDQQYSRPHGGYNGYVPEIQKVMIRDIRLDPESNDRFEEQIGLPGTYITHEIIQLALAKRDANVEHMDKTELHGSQLLVQDDLLDFVKLLDETAREEWANENIFMGEEVESDHLKDYNTFRQEALIRQNGLKDIAEVTAQFVLELALQTEDPRNAPAHVEEFVKRQLLTIAKQDIEIAEQMFDKQTADDLQRVGQLELLGRFEEAQDLMLAVERAAPGGGFCGAGSCGLEGVTGNNKEAQDLRKQLKAESGDTIVKDKERACRCGKKSIVYAFNKHKVSKLCQSCGAFETKISKAA